MEQLTSFKVICEGGLNSNNNHLELSERFPGSATELLNFEPSLFGGYRRLSGYEPLDEDYPEVDAVDATGKILALAVYDNNILTARKIAGNLYNFYRQASPWSAYVTGLTLNSNNVNKIRHVTYNFTGTEHIAFTDGANNAILFNGTTWKFISPGAGGTAYNDAGGPQALDAPKYVTLFKNHLFVSGDTVKKHLIAHSAPLADYDWRAASGAGQLNAGFEVKQIKPFRDELYVFGERHIKKIVVENNIFVLKDVAYNIGCIAPDSVVEINGDLMFLAQDGFRTIAGTERIGDVELGVMSKNIQDDVINLINNADLNSINAVVIRRKSQVRFFFSTDTSDPTKNRGVIGGLRAGVNGVNWEWGLLEGISTSVCTSSYIGTEEFVLHGSFDGKVYRQEQGNSFDGKRILAIYSTPYFDFGDVWTRKTTHAVNVFVRPEGSTDISLKSEFDWESTEVFNPRNYILELNASGELYGVAVYGVSLYATRPLPFIRHTMEGSGFSNKLTFFTNDTNSSYTIQSFVYEMKPNGRK
jgi:hypothetical protein